MVDDVRDIVGYYTENVEAEHTRLERHQLEYDITWRYLDRYLPPQGAILEIGAATGRYTLELARRGYTVTAVDLTAALLERCRQRLVEKGLDKQVRLAVADARDLSAVAEREFDAVLLMGPLYHLVLEADRVLALSQACDRLRQGGILFSSFISRLGVFGELLRDTPAWIEDREVRSFLERGRRPDDDTRPGFRAYFALASEIAPLHEAVGLQTVALAGVEPAISADDEIYNKLQGRHRELWLDLLYEISAEPSIIGASSHLLHIGRKT